MDHKREKNWHEYLAHFTFNYNHSKHSTIKMCPADVSKDNKEEVFENLYGDWTGKVVQPKFQIGDKVCVSRYKSTFVKGYEMTFHNEIYTIYKVYWGSPTVFKLIDKEDGETIFGRFYEWELQKVNVEEKQIEKEPIKGPMDRYVLRNKQT